jgi:electron transfer flavoprotein alpha subunit
MSMKEPVLVFAEQEGGKLHDVGLELIGKGRDLADKLGVPLAAALLGHNVKALAKDLIACGCDDVYVADDPRLEPFTVLPFSKVMCDIVRQHKPQIVLYGATPKGRDLAPRVASELKAGLTADCTDLQIGDHTDTLTQKTYKNLLYQIRPAFGGNIIATIVCPDDRPQMATVREGVMHKRAPDLSRRGRIEEVAAVISDALLKAKVLDRYRQEKKVNLKGARFIVSGGAGMGDRANFHLIHDLAKALGGEVGGSRSAVDSGFIGKDHQVGQTGTTVRPKLYVACGISGAVQHRAGMGESSNIIAINSDPEAPIFQFAHYGIVGDVNRVIPLLIDAIKHR